MTRAMKVIFVLFILAPVVVLPTESRIESPAQIFAFLLLSLAVMIPGLLILAAGCLGSKSGFDLAGLLVVAFFSYFMITEMLKPLGGFSLFGIIVLEGIVALVFLVIAALVSELKNHRRHSGKAVKKEDESSDW